MTRLFSLAVTAAVVFGFASPAALAGGGANLNFNGPLGNFTASPNQGGKPGHYGAKSTYAKSAAEKKARAVAAARAEERAKAAAANRRDVDVKTAKTDEAETSPAAPVIVIPAIPTAVEAPDTAAAAGSPATSASQDQPIAAATAAPEPAASETKPLCRKFSATVGAVIEVPCE